MLSIGSVILTKHIFTKKFYLFSPLVICFVYFAVRVYPGIIAASIELDTHTPLVAVLVANLGVLCSTILLNTSVRKKLGSYPHDLKYPPAVIIYTPILVGGLAILFTFAMLGRVPLFYLFQDMLGSGAEISMHAARRMNTLEHHSGDTIYFGQGYFRLIYQTIAPIFIAVLYVRASNAVQSLKLVRFLILLFCIGASLNGQIWTVANMGIFFIAVKLSIPYLFSSSPPPSPARLIKRGAVALLGIFAFIFMFRYFQTLSGREFDNFLLNTFRRIYSEDVSELFSLFPNPNPYRYGSTWFNDILGFLPGSRQSFSYEVHYLLHGGGWGFTAAPGLIGSAYVNFGMLGVFFTFIFSFLIFNLMYWRLVNSNYAHKRVLALYLSISLALAISADLTSVILPIIVVTLLNLLISTTSAIFKRPIGRRFQ
ncbi:hypothetical protein [Pusillimonas sp. ANT_WB101]|uniref:hypothetical protein n=1 Tax=Pusillimonas sp. ANT_WB101 TaxID=2597356 RepID=UPI0011EFC83D|nr:hypothetical protein [Pusillimonas sp. ANT_WB101]KAA0911327.1 hypothetical protein FQ179_05660 [Pusillimonas sp. ANT_WB101]